ncbi:phosphotransferase [Paractinoplanes maris]|uniref:phosphotransferase n=1 Tax=Paractinoplanes maris TaxID=1734446 RepID=UPI0027E10ECA|nr:phosphotransferase [Actinoplanes maris]
MATEYRVIDSALVRALVDGQFPQWADRPLRPVDPAGSDHVIHRLGDDLAVRVPRHSGARGQARVEAEWLPRLAPHLPLAVPVPVAVGEPALGYPWPWAVTRWLDGEVATVEALGDSPRVATELARFLTALRRLPVPAEPPGHDEPLAGRDDDTRAAIAAVAGVFDAGALTSLWDDALRAPAWDRPPVWFHGDFHTGNLLTVDGRVSAVIDFGGLGAGDPAHDLMMAFTLFSPAARAVFRETLGADDATWLRGPGLRAGRRPERLPVLRGGQPPDRREHDPADHRGARGVRRPLLSEAPEAVGDAVSALLGTAIHSEHPADAGFTPSIASMVTGAGARRLFVKAAPVGEGLGEAVEAGVVLAGAVGDLGPRLAGSAAVGAWRVAVYEVIEGETVRRWEPTDLPELHRLADRLRAATDPCPIGGTSPYADAFRPLLGAWDAPERLRPLPVNLRAAELADLERRWSAVLRPGSALHHGDLRRDNVIRQPDGRLRIVDWTHQWTAPGWMDVVRLAPDVAACGHDPAALLRATWPDAPADHVDVALSGLAGRAWRDGHLPGDPRLRHMQREQATHLLRWLESRRTTQASPLWR